MIILKSTVTKDLTRLDGPNDCCYAPKKYIFFSLNQLPPTEKIRHVLLEHPNKPFLFCQGFNWYIQCK